MNRLTPPRLAVLAAAVALAVAGSAFWKGGPVAHGARPAPLPTVTFRAAEERTVFDYQDYTGRLEAVDVVDVRPRVPGTLLAVHFTDGQHVAAGDLLFTIDPAPYRAQVNQAQASLAVAEERRRLAGSELARGQKLVEANAISRKEFDVLDNTAREAAASLKGADAALAQARLQLAYSQVRAPIAGRISRAEITTGNVVGAGGDATPLTRIVSDGALYASFNVDEQSYLRLIAPSLRAGVLPTVAVGLADDDAYPYAATVQGIDNQMDTRSGTVRVRARINAVSPAMLPGLQARVRLHGGQPYHAVVVDDAAVGTDQDRKFVLVVNAKDTIERRVVEPGVLQGRERVLRSGIEPGARVVIDGAFKAPPGTTVKATVADAGARP
ncbi:efflux RND transporter periplasmic adaptor subunit [Luteibacter yeojuensis]|uniref:Efflux RND transporter periplasmic adaptor subunit n=1 Tax=Luteibacter yeojuensis TaxID=345309 RepID=A0A7X5TRG9_9GAMM|nr:efflux RND transporter periplasmic adaptor subunit [Luteibacter yeojuensis]NID16833.1 efflux RND transporter periplasmic adaptor subunit [Luteibacter yeojuensis]